MKLELKLALSTGALVLAMLISASIAHSRMAIASRLSEQITEHRLPVLLAAREVRTAGARSVTASDNFVLFGLDEASAAQYRLEQAESIDQAQVALKQLYAAADSSDVGVDRAAIGRLGEIIALLRQNEQKVEEWNAS